MHIFTYTAFYLPLQLRWVSVNIDVWSNCGGLTITGPLVPAPMLK